MGNEDNVTAIIVTRGDHMDDLNRIWDSLPEHWEKIEWNNGERTIYWINDGEAFPLSDGDERVSGRYWAIKHAANDYIYVQDDDCFVGDPERIVDSLHDDYSIVASMPSDHGQYTDSCLVGWGAAFHRDLPFLAFERYQRHGYRIDDESFHNDADVVFTALTPFTRIDVGHTNLEYAYGEDRMYHRLLHDHERSITLDRCRIIRGREAQGIWK